MSDNKDFVNFGRSGNNPMIATVYGVLGGREIIIKHKRAASKTTGCGQNA
jgi:hypothetical protein